MKVDERCEICGKPLVIAAWVAPPGIDSRMIKLACLFHPGVFCFIVPTADYDRELAAICLQAHLIA